MDIDQEKKRIYDRITQSLNQQTVLERMKTLGFWPKGEGLPPEPPEELAERKRIQTELDALRKGSKMTPKQAEKALAYERERRWKESKARRAAAKAAKALETKKRREAWAKTNTETLVYLGEGVSAGLSQVQSDETLLKHRGLPILHRGEDLAKAMQISLSDLKWLTYHRKATALLHYKRYEIPKKSGGTRFISAPGRRLGIAQRWVLDNILYRLENQPEAHGFITGRSIVTNAQPHSGKAVVINLDLKDFFPTITFRRVKGLFHSIGYSEHIATVLALLCTEPPRMPIEIDGKFRGVALGSRMLPQGACTSPAITNAICQGLDRRLVGLAERHQFVYTRYADDLTFSGENQKVVGRLIRSVRSILTEEGLEENPRKTKVMRSSRRQEVTGLTVNNDQPTVSKTTIRQLRAIIHNISKHGLESQNRAGHPHYEEHLRGRIEFVRMVDPVKGDTLRSALDQALFGGVD